MSGRYNRYKFCKMLYKDYIILIINKNKYSSYNNDMVILKYLNFNMNYVIDTDYNKTINYLDKYEVNYIVLDNLNILIKKEFYNNNYYKYIKLYYLKEILKKIKIG